MDYFADIMTRWNWDYWNLIAFIVALGAVSTAILQLINDLTPVRSIYQLRLLRKWINERVRQYGTAERSKALGPVDSQETLSPEIIMAGAAVTGGGEVQQESPIEADAKQAQTGYAAIGKVDAKEALSQLIAHATGGHSRALLGLAPSQLVAQMNAAAQGALENPSANVSLIAVLSQPMEPQVPLVLRAGEIQTLVGSHIEDLRVTLSPPKAVAGDDGAADTMKSYLEARTRIVHRIQRNLDGLQITLGYDSALANQLLAILISVGICYLIVNQTRAADRTYLYSVLLVGLSGGYLAPLLGDIVAVIRRWGRT